MTASPQFRLTRYIAIQVRDWPWAIAFNRDVLGLRLHAGHEREVGFEGDAITLFVERLANDAVVPSRHAGKSFFEFETSAFDEAKSALLAAACKMTEPTLASGRAMVAEGAVAEVEAMVRAVKDHWRNNLASATEVRSHCEEDAIRFLIRSGADAWNKKRGAPLMRRPAIMRESLNCLIASSKALRSNRPRRSNHLRRSRVLD